MDLENYKKRLEKFSENIKFNYDLKKRTWFNIGGKTKIFYKAENLKELIEFLKVINENEFVQIPDNVRLLVT